MAAAALAAHGGDILQRQNMDKMADKMALKMADNKVNEEDVINNNDAGLTPNLMKGQINFKYPMNNEVLKKGTILQEFYKGANIFITGGTGFMGKVLLEKLLRSCPGIENIFVLCRVKKGKDVHTRIEEMFDDPLYERLKAEAPKFRHKMVVVPGDVSLAGLGISLTDRQMLMEKVNIVIHAAATVNFDEALPLALAINVDGVKAMLELVRGMTRLKSFVHVSTAYSNCHRKDVDECFYNCSINKEDMETLLSKLDAKALEEITPKILGEWPNTYAFTKALAENYVRENSKNLPVGIFRPAIVTSTFREPVVGWVDNMYGPTGVIAGAGTGLLRTLHCDQDMHANIVPVDLCVNSLIAAAWDIANNCNERKEDRMLIYNYVSSVENPLLWKEFCDLNIDNGFQYPFNTAVWYVCFRLNKSARVNQIYTVLLHYLPAVVIDGLSMCVGQKPRLLKMYRKVHKFSEVISFFCTHDWNFKNDNVQLMWKKLDSKDQQIFPFNIRDVDWKFYFTHYIRGMRTYLFKEKGSQEEAVRKWRRLYFIHLLTKGALALGVSYLAWSIIFRIFLRLL